MKTVTNNKIFQIRNKKQHAAIVSAANSYYSFVRSLSKINSNISTSGQIAINEEVKPQESSPVHSQAAELKVSFDGEQDFSHTKPLWLRYKDQDKVAINTWSKLYTSLMRCMVEDYPDVFMAGLSLLHGKRLDIVSNGEAFKLRRYSKLTDELLIEINISARDFVNRIAVAASIVGLTEEDIEIHYIERNNEKHSDRIKRISSGSNNSNRQMISDISDKIDNLIRNSADGIEKDAIKKKFQDYSTHQINMALEICHAVRILKKYYHRDNISDYYEMAEILLEVITRQFSQNSNYTSAQQLYNEARLRLDDFFFYNSAFDSRQEIYDLAVHLFVQEKYKGNTFIFMNNMHIWRKEPDYLKDFHGLLIKYAREHENIFTREDAVTYFEQIGSVTPAATFSNVILKSGSETFLQYAENKFVLADVLHINDYFLASVKMQITSLIHLHEHLLSFIDSAYRDILFFELYKKLNNKIDGIDTLIEAWGNRVNQMKITRLGGIHSPLFLLKSLDIDVEKGYKLGTTLAYGQEDSISKPINLKR